MNMEPIKLMPPIERPLQYKLSFYSLQNPLRCKGFVNSGRRTDEYKATGSHLLVNHFDVGAEIEETVSTKGSHS